jgi:glutathione S-transferase
MPSVRSAVTYVLYGARGSGSGIIEAICAELGVDYETRDIDVRSGENQEPAYRQLHPLGKLPTLLLPDGEIITETVAIILTLDERHPKSRLLPPPGSKTRARALRWMLYCATELYPLVESIDFAERFADTTECASVAEARAGPLEKSVALGRGRGPRDTVSAAGRILRDRYLCDCSVPLGHGPGLAAGHPTAH